MVFSNREHRHTKRRMSATGKLGLALLLGLFVAACAGGNLETDRQLASERVNAYLNANPATSDETAETMRRFELRNGMTKEQVVAVWGQPRTKKKWRHGHDDQWYFECYNWPNTCSAEGGERGTGLSDDDIYPQAFFRDGVLHRWKTP